jgi:general stress protein 26
MKIISAITTASSMTEEEIDRFLESKLNLQLASIDKKGDPNIQPIWFSYDKSLQKIFVMTPKMSKKIQNIRNKSNVYFSIDDETFPYKGIKGKGFATIVEDIKKTVPEAVNICKKYLGTLDHPLAQMITDSAKKGNHVLVEIAPKFFSTWDFGKMQ